MPGKFIAPPTAPSKTGLVAIVAWPGRYRGQNALVQCPHCCNLFTTGWGYAQKIRSCGCNTFRKGSQIIHGHARRGQHSLTHSAWRRARERCTSPSDKRWKDYGGRGITICDRWSTPGTGFLNFLADMGEKPLGYSLDRIDNDGNYEPGNCRWATAKEQMSNRRNSKGKCNGV